nr:MAG TPA: hypothetical protein [Caudoviricetes sp.]
MIFLLGLAIEKRKTSTMCILLIWRLSEQTTTNNPTNH